MRTLRHVAYVAVLVGLAGVEAPAAPVSSPERPGSTGSILGTLEPRTQQGDEAAQRMFTFARRLESEGDLVAALDEYEQLIATFPDSDLVDDALIRLVEGYRRTGQTSDALASADRLVDDFANEPGAAAGLVLRAEVEMARATAPAELERLRTEFGRVPRIFLPSTFPSLVWRSRARVRGAQASFLLGELEEAAGGFLVAIEDEPLSEWTDQAELGLATVLLWQGNWVSAAEILQSAAGRAAPAGSDDSGVAAGDRDPAAVSALGLGAPAAIAARRLELVDRLFLARSLGQPPWTTARRVSGPPLKDPVGVAARDDGRLVLVDEDNDRAFVLSPDGSIVQRGRGSEARLPAWDRAGSPMLVLKQAIVPVAGGERSSFLEDRPGEDEPKRLENIRAASHSRYGEWLLLDTDPPRVLLFGSDGRFLREITGRGDNTEPVDMAYDLRGRLHILDREVGRVLRFAADGTSDGRVVEDDWDRPEALAIDPVGNIYVLDRDAKMVVVYDRGGTRIARLGPELPGGIELRSPRDLAVDGSGRIWIVDKDIPALVVIE